MGRRGPKSQPTSLKLIKGNPGKRRLNKEEPQLSLPDESAPPKRLNGVAAAEWVRLYDELVEKGVLTIGDIRIFEEYCYTYGELRRFEGLARKCSAEMAIMRGFQKAIASLRQQFMQLAGRLGLDPSSRSGIKVVESKKPESKLQEFLQPVR